MNKAKFIGKKGAKAERVPRPHKKEGLALTPVTEAKWASSRASLLQAEPPCCKQSLLVASRASLLQAEPPCCKQSLLVEGDGGPLAACIAGANVNDHLLLAETLDAIAETLDAIVVERPQTTEDWPQHLCLDKGYDNEPTRQVVSERGYTEHIRIFVASGKKRKTSRAKRRILPEDGSWREPFPVPGYVDGAASSTDGKRSRRTIWPT